MTNQETTKTTKTAEKHKEKIAKYQIIVTGTLEKPYYEVLYYAITDNKWHIGYSSYDLDIVKGDIKNYFEVDESSVWGNILDALEKQIPKKPIKKNPVCYDKRKDGNELYAYEYHCSYCDKKVNKGEHHCRCGQALDWEEEKDVL